MADEHTGQSPFEAVAEGDRHTRYAALSAEGPVHRVVLPHGRSAWLVTDYTLARQLLTDPRLVKLGPASGAFANRLPPPLARGIHTHLLYSNPPDHTRLRRLVSPFFTPGRVKEMTPGVTALTEEILDALEPDVPVDLVERYAYPVPLRIIGSVLGMTEDQQRDLRRWTVPLMSPENVGYAAYAQAAQALLALLRQLVDEKRTTPSDDLISTLVQARDGDDRLTGDEVTSMAYLLLLAGHETTVNLITNCVKALLIHPEQGGLALNDSARIETVVEETLRYDGPVQNTMPARAEADLEVGEATIAAGELVFVSILAANRDAERFERPDTFDSSRATEGSLAFGHGVHYCLGAPLARLEARIAVGALMRRYPRTTLAIPPGDLRRVPSVTMHALEALPVVLR
jgi:cytochrome P450